MMTSRQKPYSVQWQWIQYEGLPGMGPELGIYKRKQENTLSTKKAVKKENKKEKTLSTKKGTKKMNEYILLGVLIKSFKMPFFVSLSITMNVIHETTILHNNLFCIFFIFILCLKKEYLF